MNTAVHTKYATGKARDRLVAGDGPAARDGAFLSAGAASAGHAAPQSLQDAFVRLLADTMMIRDLYAKHAAQASGPDARVFALICQRHQVEHARLVELLSCQVRMLGGDALVMAGDVAAGSRVARPPRRAELLHAQVQRLLNAHEVIATQALAVLTAPVHDGVLGRVPHDAALVASEIILTGKLHLWLLAEHLSNVSHASATVSHTACIAGGLVLPFC